MTLQSNALVNRRLVRATVLGWIAALAIDFLLNGGVFASFFNSGDQFILSSQQAFVRIPAGYRALLPLVFVEAWLIYALPAVTTASGSRVGIVYAIAVSSGSVLGLWSITVASVPFLVVWFVDLLSELTIAGVVISYARSSDSRHTTRWVVIGAITCLIGGIILQNILG